MHSAADFSKLMFIYIKVSRCGAFCDHAVGICTISSSMQTTVQEQETGFATREVLK